MGSRTFCLFLYNLSLLHVNAFGQRKYISRKYIQKKIQGPTLSYSFIIDSHEDSFWHTWLEKYQPFVTCFHSWNTNRDAYKETGEPARLAAQLAGWWGKLNRNSLLGWLGSQSRTKNSCTGTTIPTIHPRKDPFHLYSLSLHSPQFLQSAGASPLHIDSVVKN